MLAVLRPGLSQAFKFHIRRISSKTVFFPITGDFVGIKIGDEKWEIIQRNHCLLHLTRWDGQPLTIIENMAAGVPTIATAVGAIPEMIKHNRNGFLVQQNREVLDILLAIWQQKIDISAISKQARKTYKDRFTLEKYITHIEQLVMVDHAASHSVSKNR